MGGMEESAKAAKESGNRKNDIPIDAWYIMDEPFLLGLSISIWANIGVSIGNLVLAYFTYTAVKASREQIELSRKSIEKPRVVENIQNTLNTLQQELDLRIKCNLQE